MAANSARHQTVCFLILLLSVGHAAYGQQIAAAQRAYDQGIEFELEGRHGQAAQKFQEAIDINPEFGDAYYRLGESQLRAGKTDAGIKAFLQLTQIEPANVRAILAAADAYVSLDLYDDALALYSRALQLEPKSALVRYDLGVVWFHKSEYATAIRELEKSVWLNPSGIAAQRLLASACLASGDAAAAEKRLRAAIAQNPKSAELPADLANLLLAEHHVPEAEQQFRAALAVRSDYAPARLGLAKLHRRNGQTALALQEVTGVLENDPANAAALLEKGQCEYGLGSFDSAARDFAEFSRLQPEAAEGEYLLGLLDLTARRYASATSHLKRAVEKDAQLADAYYYLAEAYYNNHESDKAKEALARCLDIDATHRKALELRGTLQPPAK